MRRKTIIKFSVLAGVVVAWSVFLLFVDTKRIVDAIGVNNSYLVIFLVGALGGVSTVTSTSFYATLTTLASGGANPWLLGLVGGLAVTIGDSVFFYLGRKGEESLPEGSRRWTKRFSEWMGSHPRWLVGLVTYAYAGLTPLPNDILTVSLGVSRYRYGRMIVPLLLGNVQLTIIIAVLAAHA